MKFLYKKFLYLLFFVIGIFSYTQTNAGFWDNIKKVFNVTSGGRSNVNGPEIGCGGLPGCKTGASGISPERFLRSAIEDFVQIVAVLAVFALILSGLMYIISAGDEDKSIKAKKWILWSLVGVFIAFSSWGIVLLLNNINF